MELSGTQILQCRSLSLPLPLLVFSKEDLWVLQETKKQNIEKMNNQEETGKVVEALRIVAQLVKHLASTQQTGGSAL